MYENLRLKEELYLNQKDIAKILNIKVSTLNHWRCVKRYEIPYIKLGRVIVYPESEFIKWLNKYKTNSVSDNNVDL